MIRVFDIVDILMFGVGVLLGILGLRMSRKYNFEDSRNMRRRSTDRQEDGQ